MQSKLSPALTHSGILMIKTALLFTPFILLCLFIAELGRICYISTSIDRAMAEAARSTTTSIKPNLVSYKRIFNKQIEDSINNLPLPIYNNDKVIFNIWYCARLMDIANNTCRQTGPSDKTPVAFYNIQYDYNAIFFPIPNIILQRVMSRNGIYVMSGPQFRQQDTPAII